MKIPVLSSGQSFTPYYYDFTDRLADGHAEREDDAEAEHVGVGKLEGTEAGDEGSVVVG